MNSSLPRMQKINFRSCIICFIINYGIGIFGYLSTLDLTGEVIFERESPEIFYPDVLMLIARILFIIFLILSVPINVHPCRMSINELCGRSETWWHVLITTILVIISIVVAIVYPDILGVYNFIGGIAVIGYALVFPMFIYYKEEKSTWAKVRESIWIWPVSACCFVSAIQTLLDFIPS
jgi:hypothetical protein